jgi:hypothetical protein
MIFTDQYLIPHQSGRNKGSGVGGRIVLLSHMGNATV